MGPVMVGNGSGVFGGNNCWREKRGLDELRVGGGVQRRGAKGWGEGLNGVR